MEANKPRGATRQMRNYGSKRMKKRRSACLILKRQWLRTLAAAGARKTWAGFYCLPNELCFAIATSCLQLLRCCGLKRVEKPLPTKEQMGAPDELDVATRRFCLLHLATEKTAISIRNKAEKSTPVLSLRDACTTNYFEVSSAELSKTRAHGLPMDCRVGLRASQLERGR
ncbi:hypothetical protein F442_12442 [Phytophthora nicotianae P10297]|uniref:Uncharacterized protein n=1 Tax=Phytophthora nicotianae P10297 TaxID=1317064 RepID=W2Z1T4_PHYNI|nr:hypothetical protein F442_12442 [Phytophthora nicotianae P10297]